MFNSFILLRSIIGSLSLNITSELCSIVAMLQAPGAGDTQVEKNIPGADITRKINPAMAGLKIFIPSPPNVCLTSKIAKNEADTLKYQGKKAGRVKPKIAAVTSADKSVI